MASPPAIRATSVPRLGAQPELGLQLSDRRRIYRLKAESRKHHLRANRGSEGQVSAPLAQVEAEPQEHLIQASRPRHSPPLAWLVPAAPAVKQEQAQPQVRLWAASERGQAQVHPLVASPPAQELPVPARNRPC